jgi:hypothetical protein
MSMAVFRTTNSTREATGVPKKPARASYELG